MDSAFISIPSVAPLASGRVNVSPGVGSSAKAFAAGDVPQHGGEEQQRDYDVDGIPHETFSMRSSDRTGSRIETPGRCRERR
jgi:hypothetical protein